MQKKGIQVQFSLAEDVDETAGQYFRITGNGESNLKGVVSSIRQTLSIYEKAMALESAIKAQKEIIEQIGIDLGVKPTAWEVYQDVNLALNDMNETKEFANRLSNALKLITK